MLHPGSSLLVGPCFLLLVSYLCLSSPVISFIELHGIHPGKLTWNPNGGLEDDVPFQLGDFDVPCYFSGV